MLLERLRGISSLFKYPTQQQSCFRNQLTTEHLRSRQQFKRYFSNTRMNKINIGDLLNVCIDAAQIAGNEIRKVWKSGDLGKI
jgi:hypothetical protein